jgi:hypothetical protein
MIFPDQKKMKYFFVGKAHQSAEVAICQINLATEIPFSSPENDFFFKSVLL